MFYRIEKDIQNILSCYLCLILGPIKLRHDKSPSLKLKIAEELDRHDKSPSQKIKRLNFVKYLIFVFGLILFGIWIILFRNEIITNIHIIFSNPMALSIGLITVPVVVILMIIQKTKGKGPVVV